MLFIFLQLLLGIFCCGLPLFFLNHCRAVHRKQIGNKKVTTYIKYIIAPALYLQTQIIMGATQKKKTLKSAVSWTAEGWYWEDALWQPLNVWPHPQASAPPQLAHHRHAMWWLV